MKQAYLKSLSSDELWLLLEEISAILAAKITAEKEMLDERLRQLKKVGVVQTARPRERRRYPPVFPKFRNPDEPSETWAGRGKQPRWLKKQLRSGKRIDDFRIGAVAGQAPPVANRRTKE
jgi:DNA-binding protein H-NS